MKKDINWKKIPMIVNLVKSKLFRYSAAFIYLFAFICGLADYIIMFLVLALISMILFILSIIYDVKFIFDNLR